MRRMTIRFPDELAAEARQVCEQEGKSMSGFVVEAVADAVKRHRARSGVDSMARRRASMTRVERVGPASESLIRQLRDGRGRRA